MNGKEREARREWENVQLGNFWRFALLCPFCTHVNHLSFVSPHRSFVSIRGPYDLALSLYLQDGCTMVKHIQQPSIPIFLILNTPRYFLSFNLISIQFLSLQWSFISYSYLILYFCFYNYIKLQLSIIIKLK